MRIGHRCHILQVNDQMLKFCAVKASKVFVANFNDWDYFETTQKDEGHCFICLKGF